MLGSDSASAFEKKSYLHRWSIALAYLSLLVLGLADNMRGPLFPDVLRSFAVDNVKGSLFFSVASAMILPGGYFTGRMLDRWGKLRSLQVSLVLMVIAMLGFYLAKDFTVLLMAVVVFGISLGMMGVVQNVMVIEAVSTNLLQKYQSGLHSVYGFASLLAPLLVTLVASYTSSWQLAFLCAGVLGVLMLIISLFGQVPHDVKADHHVESSGTPASGEIWYYAIVQACYVATEIMVSTRVAQFARNAEGWSMVAANNLNTLFFTTMFIGRLVFVFWRPKRHLHQQLWLSLGLGIISIGLALLVNPGFFALTGLALAPFYPMSMTVAGRIFAKDVSSVASKAIALSGITVVLMQTSVGFFTDVAGLTTALWVGPLFSVISLVMLITYPRWFKRQLP